MWVRMLATGSATLSCLLLAGAARAGCGMDNDRPGELICEAGACVVPRPPEPPSAATMGPAPESTPAPGAAAAPASPPDAASAPAGATRPAAGGPPLFESIPTEAAAEPASREWKRHSTGMMAGGIVMVSFAPVSLGVTMLALTACSLSESGTCHSDENLALGGLLVTGVLIGVGVPLIIKGAHKEPIQSAQLVPWVGPRGGGLDLRLAL